MRRASSGLDISLVLAVWGVIRTFELAVGTVEGCDAAGIFVVRDGRVVTAAASDPLVVELDEQQFANDEGAPAPSPSSVRLAPHSGRLVAGP